MGRYVIMPRKPKPRIAECHPERVPHGHGLCWECYYDKNRNKIIDTAKKHYASNRESRKHQVKIAWLKRAYNLTEADYDDILKKQDFVCAICGRLPNPLPARKNRTRTHRALVVDHCHKTGNVRGLLCQKCNVSLWALEDVEWENKARNYLEKWIKENK